MFLSYPKNQGHIALWDGDEKKSPWRGRGISTVSEDRVRQIQDRPREKGKPT